MASIDAVVCASPTACTFSVYMRRASARAAAPPPAGKTVVGVEEDWIVGGELTCCGAGWTYSLTEISGAIDWVRVNGWVPTSVMVTQIFRAAFIADHIMK